jgi:proline iminopeptidase
MVRAETNLRAPLSPPAQHVDSQWWSVEPDVQLAQFATGQGRNVLVVHGGPGLPFARPIAGLAPLASSFRFHYYDQRGSGLSSRPIDTFTAGNYYENLTLLDRTLGLGAQVADIERIRRILGDEQLLILGHSWGGFLAALYAAEFPSRVAALVLVAPADVLVFPPTDGGLFEIVRQRLPIDLRAEYDAYLKDYLDYGNIFRRSEAELVALNERFGDYYAAAARLTLPEHRPPGGWMVHAMYLSMGRRHDYRGALQRVQAPVLVLHGTDDLQPESASRRFAASFPNARIQTINRAAHFPFEDQPALFAAAVQEFLGRR